RSRIWSKPGFRPGRPTTATTSTWCGVGTGFGLWRRVATSHRRVNKMGEAMRDLLSYNPETPAQLARQELGRALDLVHDLVLSVDLGKNVVFPCREDMVLYYAIKHIERAAKALSEHREALEQALH